MVESRDRQTSGDSAQSIGASGAGGNRRGGDDPAHIRNASRLRMPFGLTGSGLVGRQAHIRPREMPADQLPFFKIQIAVLHDRRAFPILEDPFFTS